MPTGHKSLCTPAKICILQKKGARGLQTIGGKPADQGKRRVTQSEKNGYGRKIVRGDTIEGEEGGVSASDICFKCENIQSSGGESHPKHAERGTAVHWVSGLRRNQGNNRP